MNKEMICKNCKYHYIEEISFDYPQSCCSKRETTTEEWCKCNDFEYSNRYIKQLQQDTQKYKEVIDKAMALVNNELYRNRCDCKFCNDYYLKNMRDILKEVE